MSQSQDSQGISQGMRESVEAIESHTDLDDTPLLGTFSPPSVDHLKVRTGTSYEHFSPVPPSLGAQSVVLGVDEAGRGPVLGPMVYALLYVPVASEKPLLKDTHNFLDSKVLSSTVRSTLMRAICASGSDLHTTCGWATNVLSARDISANMLKAGGTYNLNAQAMDATISLIQGVYARGVNIQEIYIDTIGDPGTYQRKLERVFPTARITVAKKADALYPCVSAASVCAKVTRDAALESCWEALTTTEQKDGWGSGYPSDARCTAWMRRAMDPVFGWGPECRFSWGTAKDMLKLKGGACAVDWPVEDEEDDGMNISAYFAARDEKSEGDVLAGWFGAGVSEAVI